MLFLLVTSEPVAAVGGVTLPFLTDYIDQNHVKLSVFLE